jgi:DNA-binding CsgD family transcriptional regulator
MTAFPELVEHLTRREVELLVAVTHGETNKQAAAAMGVSVQTVKKHMSSVMGKLGAPDRTAAVVRAIELGLIDLPHRVVPGLLVDEVEGHLLEVAGLVRSGLAEVTRIRTAEGVTS